jgi:Immunoglobulin I-set domain
MQIAVWFEQVQWYQDNIQLDLSDRRSMSTVGSKHILSIRGVRSDNFGNYSCVADNTLGRAKKYMELSGECGAVSLKFKGRLW